MNREVKEIIKEYNDRYKKSSADDLLRFFLDRYAGRTVLATSFGAEDQVLTHMAVAIDPDIEIFTLDTGRLPEETYRVWERTERRYGIGINAYYPDRSALESLVARDGINGFYESIEKRKECCRVRKTEQLKRALDGKAAWITGLRREQSVTRQSAQPVEYDDTFGLIKLNPLIEWSTGDVWRYIRENDIPYNELHDRGYPSIGCAPCTRAVAEGEDIRGGRWWWESPEHKECGLHLRKERAV
ncbi:phosphoadenylyl-sulfate reductase / adenylyl-sulfate reductase [Hydrogenimonas sp.]|nr:phosphoadenylyl-sulfate reductase / adenylyl-sulfate reductase [Hydrogenimonas sp.]